MTPGKNGSRNKTASGSSQGAVDRRSVLRRGAAALIALAATAVPFAFSRLLAPAPAGGISPKTADKSQRNILAKAKRNIMRPPGALQDDNKFIEACIGCGLCGEVCPPRCIKFHARDGGSAVNTPFIDASIKACILCNKCMEVCPTNALSVMARTEVKMGIAQIDRAACYPWVDRGICGACVSICPLGKKAISHKNWNQYQPIVHEACVGCGLCVEICPHPSTPIWIVARRQPAAPKPNL